MDKINFLNLPNTTTPVNATNLNLLQTNVDNGKVDKEIISWSSDYNNCTTTGFYIATAGLTNAPNSTATFYLEVFKYNDNNVLQRASTRTPSDSVRQTYERQLINNTWTEWLQIPQIVEGTWTPVLSATSETAPTVTYTSRYGTYKKIGKLVFVSFYVRGKITALNGTNNFAIITGLPFSVRTLPMGTYSMPIGVLYSAINTSVNVTFDIYNDSIRVESTYGSSAAKWIVTSTDYMEIGGSGWYETTA